MLTIDNLNENKVLTVSAKGKITKGDYDIILPQMEKLLEKHGKLRFLINLEDIESVEPEAAWEDLKFDRKHMDEYGKIAIVGEKNWEKWGTKISSLFFDPEMKFFYKDQKEMAKAWVNN